MGPELNQLQPELADYEFSPVAALAEWSPHVLAARDQARADAEAKLKHNHDTLMDGRFDEVYMPVDPVGDARRFLEAEARYGTGSTETRAAWGGVLLSNERALGEAMRSLTWEMFAPVERRFDADQGVFVAHGYSIIDSLDNGLSPVASKAEQARRVNEVVEEATYNAKARALANGAEAPADTWTLTLSLAGEDQDLGYVHAIDKWMARGVELGQDDQGVYRREQQAGLSGLHITEEIIDEFLVELGVVEPEDKLDRNAKLGLQIELSKTDFPELVDVIKYLDAKAGTYMGEPLPLGQAADYDRVPVEAAARQAEQSAHALRLAAYSVELARQNTEAHFAKHLLQAEMTKTAHVIVDCRPELARVVFGQATADSYEEALRLERLGEFAQAEAMRAQTQAEAPTVSYCGGGSCGLEQLATTSEAALAAAKAGLSGNLLLSKDSRCRGECLKGGKKGTVIFDMKGNKFCMDCGSADVKSFGAALANSLSSLLSHKAGEN